jgi:HlyD family secretion protein
LRSLDEIQAMTTSIPAWQLALEAESPAPSLRRLVLASLLTIAVGFGGFFAWAFTAPLDSAVPANGSIVVQSKRKTISILDGGILKEIRVKEGDRVAAGQVLLRLDDTQVQAQIGQLRAQYWGALAKGTRLNAELADQRILEFPPDLVEAASREPAMRALTANEQRLFVARWDTYEGTLAVQRKKIAQLTEQIAGLRAQTTAATTRLRFVEEELKGVMELLAKGFATKPKAFELQRAQAELKGNLGELAGRESEARQLIGQTELEMISTTNTRRSDAAKDLQDAQAVIADVSEKLRGAKDILQHKEVTAPEPGTVTDIKFFTPGSSIAPGQPILDLVPVDDRLIVEVSVRPEDIEHVHVGQRANIRLTSYKQHRVPVLSGRITYVSADRQQDQKGEAFFMARAELDPNALAKFKDVALYPGMPAEVLIIGGERLAIDYFISPVTDSFRRALREE